MSAAACVISVQEVEWPHMHGAGALSTCVLQLSMASRFGRGFVLAADIGTLCHVAVTEGYQVMAVSGSKVACLLPKSLCIQVAGLTPGPDTLL